MKRRVQIPSQIPAMPTVRPAGETPPRERRRLGVRFDVVTGDGVSGLR